MCWRSETTQQHSSGVVGADIVSVAVATAACCGADWSRCTLVQDFELGDDDELPKVHWGLGF